VWEEYASIFPLIFLGGGNMSAMFPLILGGVGRGEGAGFQAVSRGKSRAPLVINL